MSDDPLVRLLACAVLHPGLRGILVLDASPAQLEEAAALLAAMVPIADGREASVCRLGSTTTDDDIWTSVRLRRGAGGLHVDYASGPLVETGTSAVPVVVVADLSRLSVAGQRAAVSLLGADAAAVERHGCSHRWQPAGFWLAACATADIGRVTPHLLDRFPLRAWAWNLFPPAGQDSATAEDVAPPGRRLTDTERARLARAATTAWPAVGFRTAALLVGQSHLGTFSHRRMLAMGRLAVACARWRLSQVVTRADVEAAAGMLGLAGRDDPVASDGQTGDDSLAEDAGQSRPVIVATETGLPGEGIDRVGDEVAGTVAATLAGPATSVYAEDVAEPDREAAPLRRPWAAGPALRYARGPVVGHEAARSLRDIAVVPTLLHAALRHAARCAQVGPTGAPPANGGTLRVEVADLRSYRRAPVPDAILMLVLDHTARPGDRWDTLLLPYLRWAYIRRVPAAVVEVGVAQEAGAVAPGGDRPGAGLPVLRAEQFQARSVLDPRVESALTAPAGAATPLAHGLFLALQTLRHQLQHGAALTRSASLVVATDGRGNVPLQASLADRVDGPVGRGGVEDALAVAGIVARIREVRSEVVDLGASPYHDLPVLLARTLDGTISEAGSR